MQSRLLRFATMFVVLAGSVSPLPRIGANFDQSSQVRVLAQGGHPAHYIIFEMWPDGSAHPLMYRQVWLRASLTALDDREMEARLHSYERQADRLAIILQSSSGETLYQNVVEVERWLRGEFHPTNNKQATIDGYAFPVERPVFVVRVPAVKAAQLIVKSGQLGAITTFDLDQLARATPKIALESQTYHLTAAPSGSPGNRVDLLVLGDGYTSAQQAQFANDATQTLTLLFTISPYAQYMNYVNTYSLFTASSQSGADHPPYQAGCTTTACCADSAAQTDPLAGTFVNTAFDARFCTNQIHRLLTVNGSKVYAAAAAMPDWDEILIIVNDPVYGGAGGSFAVISLHAAAPQIAQHEYGHSFVRLADEYESAYPGYPSCSDVGGYRPCEVNVTDVVARSQIKWSPWISPTTPIPTVPEFDPAYANVVGLFEGARYQTTGMYRPGQNCIMRSLGAPYCQVPSQAYVLRLYTGGWGVPSSGIRLIEPGSPSPTATHIITGPLSTLVFKAAVLQPVGGPPVQAQWLVNGVPDLAAHTATFTYTTPLSSTGNITISLRVADPTPLVHPAMAGTSLQDSYVWTVTVTVGKLVFLPLVLR